MNFNFVIRLVFADFSERQIRKQSMDQTAFEAELKSDGYTQVETRFDLLA
jgi:hypothetical protein